MPETRDLKINCFLPSVKAENRKQAFQIIAEETAEMLSLDSKMLYELLRQAENTSPSAIGEGVAMPHLRLAALERPFLLFARMEHKPDFDAPDDEPVRLLLLLISPLHDGPRHLRRLSRLSRMMRDKALCTDLMDAESKDVLEALLLEPLQTRHAA